VTLAPALHVASPNGQAGFDLSTAAVARRKGTSWFVAVLNGPAARTLGIDLGFLGKRSYDALVVRDSPGDVAAVRIATATMTAASPLTVDLRAAGGFIARLTPQARQP